MVSDKVLVIPVQNTEEEVHVTVEKLPDDANDIVEILKAEQAPLNLWLLFAREYFKQGKIKQFIQILEEGSSEEVNEYYEDDKYGRIAILNALGAYYTYCMRQSKAKDNTHFMEVTKLYNRATMIDKFEVTTWIGKAQLLLMRGDFKNASANFDIVLVESNDQVAALLGKASTMFNLKNFKGALALYRKALRVFPDGPASIRLGIGLCLYRLGKFPTARLAFERVLQLDPENVEALVALGVMQSNSEKDEEVMQGVKQMRKAFELYPYCTMALNHLANHFSYTGQHQLVKHLCDSSLGTTEVSPEGSLMRAETFYQLARSHHIQGDMLKALEYYTESVNLAPDAKDFVLPHYGLGQMLLQQHNLKSALVHFEKVLKVQPEGTEALKAVAYILAQQGETTKALEKFRKVTEIDARDVEAWIELGELLVLTDFGAALTAYKRALEMLKKTGQPVPLELLNNAGVLYCEKGEFEVARKMFREALGEGPWVALVEGKSSHALDKDASAANDLVPGAEVGNRGGHVTDLGEDANVDLPVRFVSTVFNLARLHEKLENSGKAEKLFRLILKKYPKYVDCYLRLCSMAMKKKDYAAAAVLVEDAARVQPTDADVLSMRALLELRQEEWTKAKETLKLILTNSLDMDSYAQVASGYWYFAMAMDAREKKPDEERALMSHAKKYYQKALEQNPNNIYAANGLGCVMAERNSLDLAKEIFSMVQEATSGNVVSEVADVWVNLGHVFLAKEEFNLAIQMYENCLKRFYQGKDVNLLLYLARAQYDAQLWQDCKKTMQRAIHLDPSNFTYTFNMGVIMQKFAEVTLHKPKHSAVEIRQSVVELKSALKNFSQLADVDPARLPVLHKKIPSHIEYCQTILGQAKDHLESAEREEQKAKQKNEMERSHQMAEELKKKAEEARRLMEEKAKEDMYRKKLMETEEKRREIDAKIGMKHAPIPDDDEDGGDEEGDGGRSAKKEKRRRKKEKKHSRDHDDDDEEGGAREEDEEEAEYVERGEEEEEEEEGERSPDEDEAAERKRRKKEKKRLRKLAKEAAAEEEREGREGEEGENLEDFEDEEGGEGGEGAGEGVQVLADVFGDSEEEGERAPAQEMEDDLEDREEEDTNRLRKRKGRAVESDEESEDERPSKRPAAASEEEEEWGDAAAQGDDGEDQNREDSDDDE